MPSTFSHPLARHAKVWATSGGKNKNVNILVVVTTLELDANDRKYKADKVNRLSDEAAKWVSENPKQATDFMLVSRPKDWDEDLREPKHYPTKKPPTDARS